MLTVVSTASVDVWKDMHTGRVVLCIHAHNVTPRCCVIPHYGEIEHCALTAYIFDNYVEQLELVLPGSHDAALTREHLSCVVPQFSYQKFGHIRTLRICVFSINYSCRCLQHRKIQCQPPSCSSLSPSLSIFLVMLHLDVLVVVSKASCWDIQMTT